jgi:DNA-binding response OmpR family regulator
MDLMLPDLDGCEVCQRLKSDPATCDIPVVMLTAMDREAVRERCRQCGIIDFVCKPFNPDHLMAAMHRHARRNGTASAMSARGAD